MEQLSLNSFVISHKGKNRCVCINKSCTIKQIYDWGDENE